MRKTSAVLLFIVVAAGAGALVATQQGAGSGDNLCHSHSEICGQGYPVAAVPHGVVKSIMTARVRKVIHRVRHLA